MPQLPAVRAFNRRDQGLTSRKHTPTPLERWQFEFIEWFAHQDSPSQSDQHDKLEELAQRTLKPGTLHLLKARKEYKEFYQRYKRDLVKRERRRMEKRLKRTLDLHDKGVERLHKELDDDQFGDHEMALKLIPAFVNPALDRIWPKKEETKEGMSITIHLTANQEKSLEIPEGEFEVLEAESLSDDD